jgi:O-antigen ligase
MSGWLSASSLIGMLVAILFGIVANRDLRRGIVWYTVLGAVPLFTVGAFSGHEMVQGMPLAEVLATVLIVVWLLQRNRLPRPRRLPFERWLVLLVPVSLVSLASGYAFLDGSVAMVHVNMAVSFGQILLFAWPIGLYFVVADVMDRPEGRERFCRVMLALAIPQWVILALPSSSPYLYWSTAFGLIAAPMALTRATWESLWWKRVLLVSYVLPPLIEGMRIGKAFLYGYIVISSLIVLYIRARRVVMVAVPVLGLVVALALLAPSVVPVPGFVQDLIQTEESQQSLGGRSGRGQLMEDAVEIWSGYPTFGVGPGNSYPYMLRYSVIGTPHSQYADLLLECGLVGLIAFLGFLVSTLRFGWQALQVPRDRDSQMFLVAWFSSFAAMAVVSITGDYMLHSIRNGGIDMFTAFYMHWVFLGLAVALVRHQPRVRVQAPAPPPAAAAPLVWTVQRKRSPVA